MKDVTDMTKVDLSELSLDELQQLQKEVAEAAADFEKRRFQEARAELEAVAACHGFKLSDFSTGKKGGAKSASPAKYRNPEDASQTWTGKGRQPNWIKAGLATGKSLDDFAI